MNVPITDINLLLTNKAKTELQNALYRIKTSLMTAINALGTNYGAGDITLHIDGKACKVSTYNVVTSLFEQYPKLLHDAYVNKYINEFITNVTSVRDQLNQLQDPS